MRTADQPIRITLVAPDGRMGKAITKAVEDDPGFAIDQDHGDVLVDFSAPAALRASLDRAVAANVPILVGTTGLDDLAGQRISEAAKNVAVLRAANTALGITLLAELVARAAEVLGPEWDIEVLETHHRNKVDTPSGTALILAQAAARGRGKTLPEVGRFDRFGEPHAREPETIGFASLRGGTVAGDHDVKFLGPKEQIILSHRAENRMIFAKGALAGARFLMGRPAGLYSMHDVIRGPETQA
jgi:4-hydroxy-tetrahydrodipicolinate reductase